MTPSIARLRQALEAYETATNGHDEARAIGALMTEVPEAIREVLDLLDAAEKDAGRLDFIDMHRIALVPEFEGPWDAETYGEDGVPNDIASGNTVRTAIDAAISARASTAGDAL